MRVPEWPQHKILMGSPIFRKAILFLSLMVTALSFRSLFHYISFNFSQLVKEVMVWALISVRVRGILRGPACKESIECYWVTTMFMGTSPPKISRYALNIVSTRKLAKSKKHRLVQAPANCSTGVVNGPLRQTGKNPINSNFVTK